MSKFDIQSLIECKNRTTNVKMPYSAVVWMSKKISNVKMQYSGPFGILSTGKKDSEYQNMILCQNTIPNVKNRYSVPV